MTRDRERSSSSGSSVANKQPPVFDISNESGMLALLRTIHRSGAKQTTKNQLRDLLFGARGNDTATQAKIISRLDEAGFKATFGGKNLASGSVPSGQEPKSKTFGRARMTPNFSTPPQQPVDTIEVVEKSELPIESAPEAVSASPAKEVGDTAPQPPATPTARVETSASSNEQKPLPEAVPTAVESSPVPPPEGFKGDPMERIKEIKRTINERVGNPITLIDADNQIGREYMNALLSAMKVANGGRPEEVAEAMARLEQAYQGAIQVAKTALPAETDTDKFVQATAKPSVDTDTTPATVPVTPDSVEAKSVPEVAVEPPATAVGEGSGFAEVTPVEPSLPTEAEVSSPAVEESFVGNPVKLNIKTDVNQADSAVPPTPMKSAFIPGESSVEKSEVISTNQPELVKDNASVIPTVPPNDISVPPAESHEASPAIGSGLTSENPTPVSDSQTTPEASPELSATTPETPNRLMSVAKEEQLEKLMRQKKAESAEAEKSEAERVEASLDPLMIPEVTAGLKQLLSEWSLFKSSGFFGTGPGGVDHPLYKQMSGLTMAAVIAGRFEGATPQIKQSVTDYMNGWRYEEGIVHEHSETFEHYLRRVIKHILDKKEG